MPNSKSLSTVVSVTEAFDKVIKANCPEGGATVLALVHDLKGYPMMLVQNRANTLLLRLTFDRFLQDVIVAVFYHPTYCGT
jgi:hypothetical protein